MTNGAKNDSGSKPDLETIQNDIAAVKRDIATLMSHLKIGAKDGISEAAGQIGGEAARVYEALAAQGDRSAQAMGRHIEERPIMWLFVALVVGFVGGRVLSR